MNKIWQKIQLLKFRARVKTQQIELVTQSISYHEGVINTEGIKTHWQFLLSWKKDIIPGVPKKVL